MSEQEQSEYALFIQGMAALVHDFKKMSSGQFDKAVGAMKGNVPDLMIRVLEKYVRA